MGKNPQGKPNPCPAHTHTFIYPHTHSLPICLLRSASHGHCIHTHTHMHRKSCARIPAPWVTCRTLAASDLSLRTSRVHQSGRNKSKCERSASGHYYLEISHENAHIHTHTEMKQTCTQKHTTELFLSLTYISFHFLSRFHPHISRHACVHTELLKR